jgi:hypothetical protein
MCQWEYDNNSVVPGDIYSTEGTGRVTSCASWSQDSQSEEIGHSHNPMGSGICWQLKYVKGGNSPNLVYTSKFTATCSIKPLHAHLKTTIWYPHLGFSFCHHMDHWQICLWQMFSHAARAPSICYDPRQASKRPEHTFECGGHREAHHVPRWASSTERHRFDSCVQPEL